MLHEAQEVVGSLVVHADRMQRNLDSTGGLAFSQTLLLELVRTGMLRDEAYRMVQSVSHQAWDSETALSDVVRDSPEIVEALGTDVLNKVFDLQQHLRHVDVLFERVFKEWA